MKFQRIEARSAGLLCIAVALAVSGCSKSSTTSTAGTAVTASASTVAAAEPSLMSQLGGTSGVTKLAETFAKNLAGNPAVSKFLNADAIKSAQSGLVNTIAQASDMKPPDAGPDLLGALSGKGLDAAGVQGVTDALGSAADAEKLGAAQKSSLLALMQPISKSLLGQ